MEYIFFWISAAASILLLTAVAIFKGIRLPAWIIGISSVAYSMVFDIAFGDRLGLYYYISPEKSTLFLLLGALFVYPPLNIIYAVFLPEGLRKTLIYTVIWIAAMLVFEYASLLTRTVVLVGWKPLPWSVVTYVVTYAWILLFYRYLSRSLRRFGSSR